MLILKNKKIELKIKADAVAVAVSRMILVKLADFPAERFRRFSQYFVRFRPA